MVDWIQNDLQVFQSCAQRISFNLQAQFAFHGTQHLLGPIGLVTRCLGTQIALML
jgi:hypothetical protein